MKEESPPFYGGELSRATASSLDVKIPKQQTGGNFA